MRVTLVKLELQEQNKLLLRIAEALERLAPSLKAHDQAGRKSDVSDLYLVDAAVLQEIADGEAQVALAWGTTPGSEAYEQKKKIFEDAVKAESGQEGVDALFWNRLRKKK